MKCCQAIGVTRPKIKVVGVLRTRSNRVSAVSTDLLAVWLRLPVPSVGERRWSMFELSDICLDVVWRSPCFCDQGESLGFGGETRRMLAPPHDVRSIAGPWGGAETFARCGCVFAALAQRPGRSTLVHVQRQSLPPRDAFRTPSTGKGLTTNCLTRRLKKETHTQKTAGQTVSSHFAILRVT